MTQEEVLDYNKRCAEFLGARHFVATNEYELYGLIEDIDDGPDEQHFFELKDMLFHSDWNLIMVVCISLGMEFVTTNKKQLIQQIYDKLRSMKTNP